MDVMAARFPGAIWMAAMTLAGLCVLASLVLMVSPRWRSRSAWAALRWSLLAIVLALAAELLGDAERWSDPVLRPWLRMLTIGVLISVGLPLLGVVGRRERTASKQRPVEQTRWWEQGGQAALLLVVSLGLVGGARWRLDEWSKAVESSTSPVLAEVQDEVRAPVAADGVYAVTDAGQRLELEILQSDAAGQSDAGGQSAEKRVPRPYLSRVIIDSSTDSPSNCHGWVFTKGKYMIRGRYVDTILRDNQYQIVTDPQPGDLIIYRDHSGMPVHTGIVKAVGAEGFVLIESKWGSLDTYLHLPDDQVYSKGYAYYRSPRDGHELKEVTSPST